MAYVFLRYRVAINNSLSSSLFVRSIIPLVILFSLMTLLFIKKEKGKVDIN